MSQRIKGRNPRKRRWVTVAWIVGAAVIVFSLIYFERTELLYVLATLGVTALLVIVATSDLGADERSPDATLPNAQAVGSGVSSSPPKLSSK